MVNQDKEIEVSRYPSHVPFSKKSFGVPVHRKFSI